MATTALPENYQLKWHSFGTHLHSSVANSLNNDQFCDVILQTFDGHHIQAHRFILSACSQFLQQVLRSQLKIATSLPLIIILPPEINYKTLKILIQYMYSGEATVSKEILEKVLKGGDLLKIKGLWRPPEEIPQHKKQNKIPQKGEKNGNEKSDVSKENKSDYCQSDSSCAASEKSETAEVKSVKKQVVPTAQIPPDLKERKNKNDKSNKVDAVSPEENLLQFLVIKQEPLEWSENEDAIFSDDSQQVSDVKPEVVIDEENEAEEQLYTPLTCELCLETFKLPGDWVRHIQSHTDMLPAKRQRRGGFPEEDNGSFPPLHCDMCSQYFPTPAEWVHHIQDAHTEFELQLSNRSSPKKPLQKPAGLASLHKICSTCNKKFPSHASMLIHKRTHTGERPYMCEYCSKGFNVKSNLLRHLRTLHDRIMTSSEVPGGPEDAN